LYIPLGGNNGGIWFKIRNTFIIFLVSGFWHGANMTYVAWGFINAMYFLPLLILKKNRKNVDDFKLGFNFGSVKTIVNIIITFGITCLAWIFFRTKSITDAWLYIERMFTNQNFEKQYFTISRYNYELLALILVFVVVEWNNRIRVEPISGKYNWLKLGLCLAAIVALGVFSDYKEFIYFQF
jgi:D-alanyl-lipoteichoic acid acyltransferase DltB (MBOAT superfamily)